MYTENELLIKSAELYDKKKHKELEDFLDPLLIIYPGNNEFKRIAALNYLQLGNSSKGAELFAGISNNLIEENSTLEKMLKNLYENENYDDLLYFYDRKIMLNNVNAIFYYGVSLYKKGRYDESFKNLIYLEKNNIMQPETYFYIGLNLYQKNEAEKSIAYIKTAYEKERFNKTYKKTLIDLYRKQGLLKEAEMLVRSK